MSGQGHYTEFIREDRRAKILELLYAQPGFELNEGSLQAGLDAYGHRVPPDTVRDDLSWLKDRGLVGLRSLNDRLWMATLIERGQSWAESRETVPGVQRPGPR